jgi:hypothetical protein
VTAYFSAAIGWLNSILFSGGGSFPLDSARLEYLIKAVNVLFGLADAALIYLILKRIGVSRRWSLIPAAMFLFNPAVWFSVSVWGQTHVISVFFILLAIYFAELHLPTLAWLALAAGCLTRPQMLVFALIIPFVLLRKFSWRENVVAVSWTVIVAFVAVLPLTLATSPSLPIDIMLHNFNVQQGGGNNPIATTVSQDAYSIWPLVTYIAHGANSLQRSFTPSSASLIGSLTYQRFSQLITGAALLLIAAALLIRRRLTSEPGEYLPYVALAVAAFLMLFTGIVSTHFLLALPFLLLTQRWLGTGPFIFLAVAWSVSMLVPMFGDLGTAITSYSFPLSPHDNAFTRAVIRLYEYDRFITTAIVANLCALIWLTVAMSRSDRSTGRPAVADR